MGHDSDTAADTDTAKPSPTETMRAVPASETETLAATPPELSALFRTPQAPAAPRGISTSPTSTLPRPLGAACPVVLPPDTNIDPSPVDVTQTVLAPASLPRLIEPVAAPQRPSVIATLPPATAPSPAPAPIAETSEGRRRKSESLADDPNATRDVAPASALENEASSSSSTVFRGSSNSRGGSRDDLSNPVALRGSAPPDPSDGLDRNLALARLQERMLGVESEAVKIGRFIVIRKLGQGAMGIVYLAYDPKLDRKVALKLVDTSALGSELGDAQVRLEREAKAAAALGHPNVVTVYDVGNHGQDVFLAMEYVAGTCLSDWMKEEHDWRTVVSLFLEIARGLAAAHDADLVHRDFKPDNVLMGEDGRPRVADFGLARPTEGWSVRDAAKVLEGSGEPAGRSLAIRSHDALASTGEVCGTPAYMAPEQFVGIDVGAASDQFGFCTSLYEALFGHRPFRGDSITELAVAVIENDRQPLPPRHGVPASVVNAVLQGLDPDADRRHASMHALADRLDAALRARTRNRVLAGGALVAMLGGGLGVQAAVAMEERPCEAAESEVDEVWADPQRDAVRAALSKAALPDAAVDQLDAFASAWTAQRIEACEATNIEGVQSDADLQLRMACLDRAKTRLRVGARSLSEGASETMVSMLSTALGPLEECADGAYLEANKKWFRRGGEDSLEQQAVYASLESDITFLRLHGSASPAVWEAAAQRAAVQGKAHDLPHAAAVGLRWQAEAALRRNDFGQAESMLAQALPLAAVSLDRQLAPDILAAAGEAAMLSGDYVRAEERLQLALAMAERIEDRPNKQHTVDDARLTLADAGLKQHKAAAARTAIEAMLLEDVARTPRVEERIHALLGSACRELQDHPCAFQHHDLALKLSTAMGEIEPIELAGRYANVGLMHADVGDGPKAIEHLRKAAEIIENAFDANHPMRGGLLSDIGGIEGALMDPKDGERDLLTGLAIHEHNHGKDGPQLVEALIDLNKTQLKLGKFEDAQKHGQWALRIVDAAFEGQHPRRADPRMPLADAYAATGRFDDAAEALREGLEILDTPKTHPMQRAEFQFALARALAPNDPDAARQMSETAVAGIANFEPGKPLRDAIEGWRGEVLDAEAGDNELLAQPSPASSPG